MVKITRALLLSSKKQAEAFETEQTGMGLLTRTHIIYWYLVADHRELGDGLVFEIYRVTKEPYLDDRQQERERDKVADTPHFHEEFKDAGELINFLRRYQIDFENGWYPVEREVK